MNNSNMLDRLGNEDYVFMFDGKEYRVYNSDIPIDGDDLSEEFIKQPSLYAYIALLEAKADNEVRHKKLELDEIESRVYDRFRSEAEINGSKLTEATINSRIKIHADVMKANRDLLNAQNDLSVLKALETSLRIRSDMLIRAGAYMIAEMNQTGMNLREKPSDKMKKVLEQANS